MKSMFDSGIIEVENCEISTLCSARDFLRSLNVSSFVNSLTSWRPLSIDP